MNGWVVFGSAIAGALVGGAATILEGRLHHRNVLAAEERREKERIKAGLHALCNELMVVWDRYWETFGPQFERLRDGDMLPLQPITMYDYFTIYDNNTSLLGYIEDEAVRKNIVSVYTLFKGHADAFRLYMEWAQRHEYWESLAQQTNNQMHQEKAKEYRSALIAHAKLMQAQHETLKLKADHLIFDMRPYADLYGETDFYE